MYLQVNGHSTYCYTGGKPFDAAKPTVVFIHGVLNDHSVWILQSRYLANHGWNVLAVDLPGHCRSEGEAPPPSRRPPTSSPRCWTPPACTRAALVGHSWGSLIALEAAARLKERVTPPGAGGHRLPDEGVAGAAGRVAERPGSGHPHDQRVLARTLAAPPSALGPGTWVYGASMALGRRVLRSNAKVNVFHRGFKACDSYANGEAAMQAITCPVLFVLGAQDQMTQPKAAQVADRARPAAAARRCTVTHLPVGHHQMTETPDDTLFAIRDFLGKP